MGVVLAHDFADDARRLFVSLIVADAQPQHAVQHAALHGLEPVAGVGQRAADDDAHRVVEIASFYFRDERIRYDPSHLLFFHA